MQIMDSGGGEGAGAESARAHGVLLFDGVCNLCNGAVDFILRRERAPRLRFASLQSDYARRLLAGSDVDPERLETLVFVRGGEVFVRSDAVFAVCGELRAPWRWLRFLRVLPRRFRDRLYRCIAGRRYRWFGRRETCRMPLPEEKERFLG
ncbi:MAG: thiol-disulfide oxidoreductase DCC family protein [Opitutales bacterium]|nr:thiol-disulfide oxidoreductase DCC family protein [Opitutales bacterium]